MDAYNIKSQKCMNDSIIRPEHHTPNSPNTEPTEQEQVSRCLHMWRAFCNFCLCGTSGKHYEV